MNNGKDIIYDINKICDFVFGDPNNRNNDVEITEKYDYKMNGNDVSLVPKSKEVKEVKQSDYTGQNTIRYDMIKMFMSILDDAENLDTMTLGERITYNTMEAYELIKNVKDIEEDNE